MYIFVSIGRPHGPICMNVALVYSKLLLVVFLKYISNGSRTFEKHSLPYQGIIESLTDTKIEGSFLVMGMELEMKLTIKKLDNLTNNSNISHQDYQDIKIVHLVCYQCNAQFSIIPESYYY